MHNYQQQNSTQTLAQGMAEYLTAYQEQLRDRKGSSEAQQFFRCHDVVHVVFGCDISLDDEAVVKLSSMFGTTAGFGVLRGYQLAESKEVYTKLGLKDIVLTTLHSFVLVPRTIWRCLRMPQRWLWDDFEQYLDMPLQALRSRFGIRVAHL